MNIEAQNAAASCKVCGSLGFWEIARRDPSRVAIIERSNVGITFGDLSAMVNGCSRGLLAMGLGPEAVVAALLPNDALCLVIQLAVQQIGMYFVPLGGHRTVSEIASILNDCEPQVIVAATSSQEATRAAAETAAATSFESVPTKVRLIEEVMRGQSTSPPAFRRTGQNMFYTSGTTGRPKGVRRPIDPITPEEKLARVLPAFVSRFGLKVGDGVHLVSSSLCHVAPNWAAVRALHIGHRVVFMDRVTPEEILKAIQRYNVTTVQMVPTVFSYLLSLPSLIRNKYDVSSLTHVAHSGARCPRDVKQRMIEWLGPILHETYGATEVGSFTYVNSNDWLRHPGTVGRAIPGTTLTILDESGLPLPPGEPGLIYMRRDGQTFEYLGDQDEQTASKRDGFVSVGDIGYLDEEGWLYVCDRRTDLIVTGGMNVYPAEVEEVLLREPAIVAAAVIGVPDSVLGQRIVAIVEAPILVSEEAQVAARLLASCRQHLSNFKRPTAVEFRLLGSAKISRAKIRDEYLSTHDRPAQGL